jgi:choline/glycine/proline betaine transport protein
MCYTVYLGLDNEYEILESEQYAERVEDMSTEPDIRVVAGGDDPVTSARGGVDAEGTD